MDAIPRSARASGAAHSMDEVLRNLRQIVVNDVRDILDVNAARSQIGCNQDAIASLLKSGQRCGPLRLRPVRHESWPRRSLPIQILRESLGSALGAREYEASARLVGQQPVQHSQLAIGGNFESLKRTFSEGFSMDPKARRTGLRM